MPTSQSPARARTERSCVRRFYTCTHCHTRTNSYSLTHGAHTHTPPPRTHTTKHVCASARTHTHARACTHARAHSRPDSPGAFGTNPVGLFPARAAVLLTAAAMIGCIAWLRETLALAGSPLIPLTHCSRRSSSRAPISLASPCAHVLRTRFRPCVFDCRGLRRISHCSAVRCAKRHIPHSQHECLTCTAGLAL